MRNINTLQTIPDNQALKADTWAYALNKFSIGNTDMEDGINCIRRLLLFTWLKNIANKLDSFRKPNTYHLSLEERNTPTKTERAL